MLLRMSEGVKVISVAAFHNTAVCKWKAKCHIKADKNTFLHQLGATASNLLICQAETCNLFSFKIPREVMGLFHFLISPSTAVILASHFQTETSAAGSNCHEASVHSLTALRAWNQDL